jgi:hypothetical protein
MLLTIEQSGEDRVMLVNPKEAMGMAEKPD